MGWLAWMLAAALVLAGDQLSKAWVLARPAAAAAGRQPVVGIHCVLNRRGALAPFVGPRLLVLMWAALAALLVLCLHAGLLGEHLVGRIGLGAAIGGAAGNVVDRLYRGAIVDFIAVGPWPLFNVADAAIVAGVGMMLVSTAG
jgi:signal peptidase II